MADMKDITIPVATDRTGIVLAEILAQLANVLADKKVLGLKIGGVPVTLNPNDLNLQFELDGETMTYENGKLKVVNAIFAIDDDSRPIGH